MDPGVVVRPMRRGDLPEAERVYRLAFGTHKGLPDPMSHGGDTGVVACRFAVAPQDAFVAEIEGRLAGSNFLTAWGTSGYFGPLSVEPSLWNRGIAKLLVRAALERARERGVTSLGLFTFADSVKHLASYQRFGFRPGHLTIVMSRGVSGEPAPAPLTYSSLNAGERAEALAGCRRLTGAILPGFDPTVEVEAATRFGFGDTLLLTGGGEVKGFAACHAGAGTEGGSGVLYVKFGAVRTGPGAEAAFSELLAALDAQAARMKLDRVAAGVNTARERCYDMMLEAGFALQRTGVAMRFPGSEGYNRPGVFALDDWR